MPDALSKTVPIWICVMNRLLFPHDEEASVLHTPSSVVSPSEHSQIEEQMSRFVQNAKSLALDIGGLKTKLGTKPMMPLWVTPRWMEGPDISSKYNAIILYAASSCVSEPLISLPYIQGAGDDSENWACGLDAATFWRHQEKLLTTAEDDLARVIHELISQSQETEFQEPIAINVAGNVHIATNAAAKAVSHQYSLVISCGPDVPFQSHQLDLSSGKVGSRKLRTELAKLIPLLPILRKNTTKTLVTCETGRDLSIGVCLAILCLAYSDDGTQRPNTVLNKTAIKQRLSWISTSFPSASPSRTTLQSVNAFILS
ncbi:hypothetical protein K470DRAFT_257489 [Piedraia hortae CBS 480.64]|uniref:Initiator tRNA phosphoribosyl transferase n=1 Tax=Piedraia hortae CBS 480.64 TaxID=1314780 RepID=A0A6A7C0A4_9PEZI|nr:hypothetical protein K470DRAFT_257489 [Piedraia hortae CBS 480.64]